jgi:hypothetical protein
MSGFKRLAVHLAPQRLAIYQLVVALLCCGVFFGGQASAVTRFEPRSLYINSSDPGATTSYKVSLTYTTLTTVGSLDMLFCQDPIPYDPCVAPPGLDVTNAVLSNQTGSGANTGFSMQVKSSNHLLLTRTPTTVDSMPTVYTFDNIVNPTDTSHSFAIRLSDYAGSTGSAFMDPDGSIHVATTDSIDVGSVVSQVGNGIEIDTQVPPIMIFCINHTVAPDCSSSDGDAYTNLGTLDPTKPLTTTAQMAVATNAFNGFTVSVYGTTMTAGTNEIPALAIPTASAPGNNQFGLNLRANTSPAMGADPDGVGNNAVISPDYDIPNEFTYRDGDTLVSADTVSLGKRFTISYILNTSPNVPVGVYTTTLTYFATGNF